MYIHVCTCTLYCTKVCIACSTLCKIWHCQLYKVQNLTLPALHCTKFCSVLCKIWHCQLYTLQYINWHCLLIQCTSFVVASSMSYILYYKLALPALHRIQHLHCHLFTVKNVAFLAFMIFVLNWWNSWRKTDVYIQYINIQAKLCKIGHNEGIKHMFWKLHSNVTFINRTSLGQRRITYF